MWFTCSAGTEDCAWSVGVRVCGNGFDLAIFLYISQPQSRQSAKLFSSRRNWDSPNPSPAGECAPLALVPEGGAHSLARVRLGESQFRRLEKSLALCLLCGCDIYRKTDIHCRTLFICVLYLWSQLQYLLGWGREGGVSIALQCISSYLPPRRREVA